VWTTCAFTSTVPFVKLSARGIRVHGLVATEARAWVSGDARRICNWGET
jgi:hypothetical protein